MIVEGRPPRPPTSPSLKHPFRVSPLTAAYQPRHPTLLRRLGLPSPPYEAAQFAEPAHVAGATSVPACSPRGATCSPVSPRLPSSHSPPWKTRKRVRKCALSGQAPSTSANVVRKSTAMNWPAGTKATTQRGELSRQEQAACSSTSGNEACIADERTPKHAEVRGAAQRSVVNVFSFSPFAYRVQGSTEPTGALCPHRRPSGRGAQESTVYSSTRCACRRRSHAKQPEPTTLTRQEAVS